VQGVLIAKSMRFMHVYQCSTDLRNQVDHLPKLRLKFGSIRGALHFKSLCNKALKNKKKRIDKMMIKNKKAPDGAFL